MEKIMILDEYPSIRELLAEELSTEGYLVMPMGNPAFISNFLLEFNPDLAILDLFIHGKWRWNLLKEIRKGHPDLPIILFAAEWHREYRPLLQGVDWVIKSAILDELKEKIREILKPSALERNASARPMNDLLNT